jgi:hypothetical protein
VRCLCSTCKNRLESIHEVDNFSGNYNFPHWPEMIKSLKEQNYMKIRGFSKNTLFKMTVMESYNAIQTVLF